MIIFIMAILCGCFPPSVQPARADVSEYNPKKAGAEIAARYEAVTADNITLSQNKMYLLSGSSQMCTVTIYDLSHDEPTLISDMTFDISAVMPSYSYRGCKCLIPYNNKLLMLMSLDTTADLNCNAFFSINDDGSQFAVWDVSNDIPDLDKASSANYSPVSHTLHLYHSYKIDYDTRYILYEYSFDETNDTFSLRNFYPTGSVAAQNDGYKWSWSYERCGYTSSGAWLSCQYLTITPTDGSLPSHKIGYGYLDLSKYYDDLLTVFSIDNEIWLYIHQRKSHKYEFIKLHIIE